MTAFDKQCSFNNFTARPFTMVYSNEALNILHTYLKAYKMCFLNIFKNIWVNYNIWDFLVTSLWNINRLQNGLNSSLGIWVEATTILYCNSCCYPIITSNILVHVVLYWTGKFKSYFFLYNQFFCCELTLSWNNFRILMFLKIPRINLCPLSFI